MVSVIVPVYNAEKYLDETVQSVISQTIAGWELILVDDGSKDSSLKIAEGYAEKDQRIKVFTHPANKNRGVSATRNLGIRHARGEYISLLDADDLWDKRKLEKQLAVFHDNPGVAIVYAQLTTLFNETYDDFPAICGAGDAGINNHAFEKMVRDQLWMPNSSVIFKRDVLSRVKKFNEKLYYQVEDHLFFTKVVYFYPCYFLKETVGQYRVHNASYTYNTKWKNSLYEFLFHLLFDFSIHSKIIILRALFSRMKSDLRNFKITKGH